MTKFFLIQLTALVLFTSCGNSNNKKAVPNSYAKKKNLNSHMRLENTTWILKGYNNPDSIYFVKPDTLLYVSSETDKEWCGYKFKDDTLIYIDKSEETNVNNDIYGICISKNRLYLKNPQTLQYIYFDKQCVGDKEPTRWDMKTMKLQWIMIN